MSETTTPTSDDPLHAVADAMQAAVDSAKQGVATVRDAATAAMPTATHFLSRFVYTTCYTISYGVVFPTALVAMSVPKNNAFVQGLVDGAEAAKHKADDLLGQYGNSSETPAAAEGASL